MIYFIGVCITQYQLRSTKGGIAVAYDINNDNTGNYSDKNEADLDVLYEKPILTKKQKISNFIHYYKSAFIFATVAIVMIVFLTIQALGKTDPDLYVLYAGRYYLNGDSYSSINKTLTGIMNDDYNGDGTVYIEFISQTVKTREQAEKEQQESDEYLFTGDLAEGMESFRTEIMAGMSVICLLDEQLYDDIADEGRLTKLIDVLGYTPEGAKDDFGIYLKDTPFADACPEFTELSDTVIVCFKKRLVTNDSDDYINHLAAFRKLFNYEAPEA